MERAAEELDVSAWG